MSRQKLTDALIKDAQNADREYILWDEETRGFGVRVSAKGVRTFILNYTTRLTQRQRQYSIGRFPDWSVKLAREEAKELKQRINRGGDPMQEVHDWRKAPTVKDLADHYRKVHLPGKRPGSQRGDEITLAKWIEPKLGKLKVAAVTHADIAALHREITAKFPTAGNRTVALISTMFNLAVREGWRDANPAKGIRMAPETPRERFLTEDEVGRLKAALDASTHQSLANTIRLALFTGARIGEVLAATWSEFDLSGGTWTKPSSHTKQKRTHRIPLSAAALALLEDMRMAEDERVSSARAKGRIERRQEHLFPGRKPGTHIPTVHYYWQGICEAANIKDCHIHDLRHSFASVLVGQGLSLPVIGALLGHTQAGTTHRYAHLDLRVLRQATEAAGAAISAAQEKVTDLAQARAVGNPARWRTQPGDLRPLGKVVRTVDHLKGESQGG